MLIDHIGYAVRDLTEAAEKFMFLGYHPCGESTEDPGRKVRIQFFANVSGVRIELIAPLQEISPVTGWLKKNGNAPYHLCYVCNDMEDKITELKGKGFILVHPPTPAPAMENRHAAFLYSASTGVLELVEKLTRS